MYLQFNRFFIIVIFMYLFTELSLKLTCVYNIEYMYTTC